VSRLQLPVILLMLLLTLAACTRNADEVHEATLAAVTPGVISPADELPSPAQASTKQTLQD